MSGQHRQERSPYTSGLRLLFWAFIWTVILLLLIFVGISVAGAVTAVQGGTP